MTEPGRCERCEQPHGTCHHTAPEIAVGDMIHPDMTLGAWSRALAMRSNSRAIDAAGNEWVKTRRRDGAWENLTDGAAWPLNMIIDAEQGYGPLTVEHIAGRRVSAATRASYERTGANLRRAVDAMVDHGAVLAIGPGAAAGITEQIPEEED